MRIFILIIFLTYIYIPNTLLAASSPSNVGEFFQSLEGGNNSSQNNANESQGEVPQSLPGIEIKPEDMQQAFPTPLKKDSPHIDFVPDAAPLFPVLMPSENTKEQKQDTQNNKNEPTSPFSPQSVPSVTLTKPSQANENWIELDQESAGSGAQDAVKKDADIKDKNKDILTNPSLEYMLGQMIMAGFTGEKLEEESAILHLINEGKVGGVFLVPQPATDDNLKLEQASATSNAIQANIISPTQLKILTATLQAAVEAHALPLFIATVQEGGMVQSLRPDLGFTGSSSAAKLGQGDLAQTEIAARSVGLEMAGLGINLALGPAGDVNYNPLSEDIGKKFRSFSPNPDLVAKHVQAFGKGLVAARVMPCLRNFPGTGSRMGGFATLASENNSQNLLHTLPDIGALWRSSELLPYGLAIKSGWRGAIQPALAYHRTYDALNPITLSQVLLSGVLRGQLGFDGLIISEDLRKLVPTYNLDNAVVQAVLAGVDILLITEPAHITVLPQAHNPSNNPLVGQLEGMLGTDDLTKTLLQQGLGKAMPNLGFGGFGATLEQKIQTGHADNARKVYEILHAAVLSGRIPMDKIRASYRRIVKAKQEFLMNGNSLSYVGI